MRRSVQHKRPRRARAQAKAKATTQDVLGAARQPKSTARIPAKWRPHYQRLVSLRSQFLDQRADLAQDALQEQLSFSTHMADAATDTYDRDLSLAMLSTQQDAVYQVQAAIDRIHSGTYGICELTGRPIEPARLEAVPWTRFSLAAEEEIERQQASTRPRLGARRALPRGGQPGAPSEEVEEEPKPQETPESETQRATT